jgi:hypothetical protein
MRCAGEDVQPCAFDFRWKLETRTMFDAVESVMEALRKLHKVVVASGYHMMVFLRRYDTDHVPEFLIRSFFDRDDSGRIDRPWLRKRAETE